MSKRDRYICNKGLKECPIIEKVTDTANGYQSDTGKREHMLTVYLNDEEMEKLKKAADEMSIGLSPFVRFLISRI